MVEPTRLEHYERRMEWPLATVALVFLAVFTVRVLVQPRGALSTALEVVWWTIYAAFVIDYIVRFRLATQRPRWFVRHLCSTSRSSRCPRCAHCDY
jgi:voltage-gated potassium channel